MLWEEQFGYSQAVKAGDTIYLSGQVSHDDEGDIIGIGDMEVQMCQAYANIHKVLAQYGSTIDDLVEEHVFVTDMEAAFAAAVKIMREVFSGFPTVASTIVQIQRLAFPELIGMAPNLERLFLLELLLVALVFILMVAGAVYIAIHDRRIRRKIGRQVGTADIAVGATSQERASVTAQGPAPHQPPRREFYERTGLQRGVQMKMRLYSINDYESELKGVATPSGATDMWPRSKAT